MNEDGSRAREPDGSSAGPRPDEGLNVSPLEPSRVVEAVLFAADAPVGPERLAQLAGADAGAVAGAVVELNRAYQASGRTFRINKVAQGYQLYTMPEYAQWVRDLYQHQYVHRLSRAALEVLAIVAYRQPITRPETEKLRSVDCSGPLLTLLERRLIATAGRAHRPGNPFLYRTTREFLRYFGLESLDDLPRLEELGEFLASHQPGSPGSGEPEPRAPAHTFDSLAVDLSRKEKPPEPTTEESPS